MSSFLNQFDKDPEITHDDTVKIEQKDRKIKEEKSDISVQPVTQTPKLGAFASEDIVIDKSYYYIKMRKTIIVCATVLIIFIIGVLIFISSFFDVVVGFVNQPLTEMQVWAEDNNVKLDIDYQVSDEIVAGNIISQTHESGKLISKFGVLKVVVSEGPDMNEVLKIPDFKGKTVQDIKLFVDENSISKAKIEYTFSDTVKKDEFISISFMDGVNSSNYTRSDELTFTISKGKETELANVKMPNFEGKSQTELETWASENMIYLKVVPVYSELPIGTIISQDVKADTQIAAKTTVNIEVSKGVGIAAPSFYGLNQKQAEQLALESKVNISVVTQYSDVANGQLIYQSVDIGSSVYEDDTIKLVFSLGLPFINDLTGLTHKEAIDMIVSFNLDGASLSYNTVYKDCGQEFTKGTVCSVSPVGEFVEVGSNITLYVQK